MNEASVPTCTLTVVFDWQNYSPSIRDDHTALKMMNTARVAPFIRLREIQKRKRICSSAQLILKWTLHNT